jgi:phage shock protein PspC (stress-responsive transcriptional regulator)
MTSTPPGTSPTADPTAQPTGGPTTPRLRRSSTERMLGGVSGGLAEYSGIDAVLWRVGFVVLTCAGGAGVLAYLLLWVLMPAGPAASDERPSALEQLIGRLHDALSGGTNRPQG